LQVLRRPRQPRRLQGYSPAPQLRLGARQDHPASHLGELRPASAAADPCRPPRAHGGPARPDRRV